MENVLKDANSLLEELIGSGFSGPEKLILEKGTELKKSGPNSIEKWMYEMSKEILCSGKYQKLVENQNQTKSLIGLKFSELICQFCAELQNGKSIPEAMNYLKIDPELLIEELYKEPKIQNRIQKPKLRGRISGKELTFTLKKEQFVDHVYLAFDNLMRGC